MNSDEASWMVLVASGTWPSLLCACARRRYTLARSDSVTLCFCFTPLGASLATPGCAMAPSSIFSASSASPRSSSTCARTMEYCGHSRTSKAKDSACSSACSAARYCWPARCTCARRMCTSDSVGSRRTTAPPARAAPSRSPARYRARVSSTCASRRPGVLRTRVSSTRVARCTCGLSGSAGPRGSPGLISRYSLAQSRRRSGSRATK
mmetsp:Transcript_20500/g.69734  ORF Transcript_20500/g.69734 Transcript_20500/m.69734 type:complete len:208 (+) Transcript_20500:3174-3797(+)